MSIIKHREETGDEGLLTLAGEVDMHSSNDLRSALLGYTKKKLPRIVCDMGDVSYIDSSGLATLIECYKTAKAYDGALVLRNVQPKVLAVFKLAHLDGFFLFE